MENHVNKIDKLYVTEIYKSVECDKFFPKINTELFKIQDVSKFKEENEIYFRYFTYNKRETNIFYNNYEEEQYKNLIKNILTEGLKREDRTGTGTLSLFAPYSMKYNLEDTFPLCTLKRGFFRAVFEELLLYIRGQTDNNILKDKKIHIWDGNTTREFLDTRGLTHLPEGDMGETYGFNMRHYGGTYIDCKTEYDKNNGFDQLEYVINEIKNNPHSRRILINLWNPKTTCNAALPSCLHQYQFYVDTEKKTLSVQIYLRSSDVFLANNWNVCTGALFVYLLCNLKDIDLTPGDLTMVCGDAHIYKNHIELAEKMIERESFPYPKLVVLKKKNRIEDFVYEDIKLIGYKSHPNDLKGEMAV
jgi:thymidylate synthase